MKNKFRYFLLPLLLSALSPVISAQTPATPQQSQSKPQTPVQTQTQTQSQTMIPAQRMPQIPADTPTIYQVAIFAPLFLDSAFDAAGIYRYDNNFPKFLNPGLEFYEGAQLALDSLQKEQVKLDVRLYDTRSATQSIADVVHSPEFQNTGLIIGLVENGELQQLANAASHKHIPFINANFPNDGGITDNPELVILNSTLKTHCEGIYKFLQKNYPTRPIVLFRKNGAQEDRLLRYFTDIGKTTASVPLKIKVVNLDENFDANKLLPSLDSNRKTICIAGSLDENFGLRLCQQISSLNKTYHTIIIGMPNWDNIGDFSKPEYSDEDILYSTPFYMNPADNLVGSITQDFKTHFFSRPSDMVFRGYETTYRFAKLLLQYGAGINGSIGEKKYKVFNDFDIQPVFLNRQNMVLDYLENKKLYFLQAGDHELFDTNGPKKSPASPDANR